MIDIHSNNPNDPSDNEDQDTTVVEFPGQLQSEGDEDSECVITDDFLLIA